MGALCLQARDSNFCYGLKDAFPALQNKCSVLKNAAVFFVASDEKNNNLVFLRVFVLQGRKRSASLLSYEVCGRLSAQSDAAGCSSGRVRGGL